MPKLFQKVTKVASAQNAIYASITLALLPYGSVLLLPKMVMGIAVSVSLLMALTIPVKHVPVRSVIKQAWWLLVILTLFALAQSLQFDNHPLAHPFWQSAGEMAGFHSGAISVEPSLTRYGLFSLIPPFFLFIAILHAFQGDEQAWRLIRFLCWLAVIFTIYGFVQMLFFPDYVLLHLSPSAGGDFTSVLINRNHAGTVIGVASFLVLSLVIKRARGIKLLRFPQTVFLPSRLSSQKRRAILLWCFALFMVIIALFLTRSRGAFGATIIGWGLILPSLISQGLTQSGQVSGGFRVSQSQRTQRIVFGLLGLCVTIGFIGLFAEGTLFRLASTSGEAARFCAYPDMFAIFLDNWLLGAGFNTFEAIYPIYRQPDCGVEFVWLEAHNFWLEGLIGFGILFLPVACFVLWRFFSIFRKGLRTRRSMRYLNHIGIAIVAMVSLHGCVEFSLQIPGVAIYVVAALAGLSIMALQRVKQ